MKNNITIIGINFYPEDTAIGLYSTQMAGYLSAENNVSVVTGVPYYPQWEVWDDYKDAPKRLTEKKGNITIYRYKQYVPENPTFKNRILHLLDFTFGSVKNIFKIKKCDLVICVVPFTTSIVLGIALAKFRGAKIWVHIQDFEFDAALESGLVASTNSLKSRLFGLLFSLERSLLNRAVRVSTISYGMLEKLKTKTNVQCYYFPNWIDETIINPEKAKTHCYLTSDKFKVLYSGNIGTKQDWDFFLRVANAFKDDKEIEFIVVGAGAKQAWLIEQTTGIENVRHYAPVEYAELSDLLCSADMHILFQKNDVVDAVMPSKLLGMMASARPSIVTGNLQSEVAKIFKLSQGGYFYNSDDINGVIKQIIDLKNKTVDSVQVGIKARKYVIEHFSKSKVLPKFEDEIKTILRDDTR